MLASRSHGAVAVLLSLVLAACNAETDRPPPAVAAAGPDGEPGHAIGIACQSDDAIDAAQRTALHERAQALYSALRDGQTETLWDELHPQARRDDMREPFMEALRGMQHRLQGSTGPAKIERTMMVDVRGGINSLAKVSCSAKGEGTEDSDEGYTLLVNAGDEDVAVVILASDVAGTEHGTTISLRRRGDRWRLLGVQVNASRYRGKSAAAYEIAADVYMRQQKVVAAFLLLGLAQALSDRGQAVESGLHERIEEKIVAIQRDQLFAAETGTWALGSDRFRIEGLSLLSTPPDVAPVIKYVSPQGLVKDLLDRDADLLVEEVVRRFPELPKHFDSVVFEAYERSPSEPGQSYQAYRVVRYFDPSKRRG